MGCHSRHRFHIRRKRACQTASAHERRPRVTYTVQEGRLHFRRRQHRRPRVTSIVMEGRRRARVLLHSHGRRDRGTRVVRVGVGVRLDLHFRRLGWRPAIRSRRMTSSRRHARVVLHNHGHRGRRRFRRVVRVGVAVRVDLHFRRLGWRPVIRSRRMTSSHRQHRRLISATRVRVRPRLLTGRLFGSCGPNVNATQQFAILIASAMHFQRAREGPLPSTDGARVRRRCWAAGGSSKYYYY